MKKPIIIFTRIAVCPGRACLYCGKKNANSQERSEIVAGDYELGDALSLGLRRGGHVVNWFTDGNYADAAFSHASLDAIILTWA